MIYNSMSILQNGCDLWINKLQKCCEFFDTNKKRPAESSKNIVEKTIGKWLGTQKKQYGNSPENSKFIMKKPEIYNEFTDFLEKYKEYFIDFNNKWIDDLQKCIEFIDTNKKRPAKSSKNIVEKTIGKWLSNQKGKYGNSPKNSKFIMKKPEIYNEFTNFLEKYKEYFPKKDKKILPTILNKETLEKLNVLDLQNICKDKNIPFMSRDKKQILIEKIINPKEDETNDYKTIKLENKLKKMKQTIIKQ